MAKAPPVQDKKRAKELYYRKIIHGDKVVEYPVLKELELKVNRVIEWAAVSKKLTTFDKA